MIAADTEAAVFSVKSFVAAMIAYYIALSIGFSQPVSATITVYLVSQPLAGAVLSKALYRLPWRNRGRAASALSLFSDPTTRTHARQSSGRCRWVSIHAPVPKSMPPPQKALLRPLAGSWIFRVRAPASVRWATKEPNSLLSEH
jgi:hypothetical protein